MLYDTHGLTRGRRRVTFTFTRDDWTWELVLRPRLGLYQLAEQTVAGRPLDVGRSVYEYALTVTDGRRRRWVGNWHKYDLPLRLTVADDVRRRSLLLNPLAPWRRLAISDVRYLPTPDGLRVERTLTWLSEATIKKHYTAMLPLGVAPGVDGRLLLDDGTTAIRRDRGAFEKLYVERASTPRVGETETSVAVYQVLPLPPD